MNSEIIREACIDFDSLLKVLVFVIFMRGVIFKYANSAKRAVLKGQTKEDK